MPTYKVLGQSAPAVTTMTDIYTAPAGGAIVSGIWIANRSTAATTYRIAVRPAGAALANQHYIAHDIPLAGTTTDQISAAITLAATDVITVYVGAATISVTLFGTEAP